MKNICFRSDFEVAEKVYINRKHFLNYTLKEQIDHGIRVSNLAAQVARQLGMEESVCHELAVAGVVHDIGKIVLGIDIGAVKNPLVVEEMKYVRMHARISYDILKERGYSSFILQSILHHHENMDGSGYPDNLRGEEIPYGARILRVCDVYAALTSDRPYRSSFDKQTAMELMIEEVKNFDMKVFLAFQRLVHEKEL